MTSTDRTSAVVGDVLTALATTTIPDPAGGTAGITVQRATTFTVTESLLEDTRDRSGRSWLSDLSVDAQLARWGEQRFVVGDVSGEIFWWEGSSASAKLAYDHEMYNAALVSDPEKRTAEVEAIRAKFKQANLNPSKQTVRRMPAVDPFERQDVR